MGLVGPAANDSSCLNLMARMYHSGPPRTVAELVSLDSLAALSCFYLAALYASTSQPYKSEAFLVPGKPGSQETFRKDQQVGS